MISERKIRNEIKSLIKLSSWYQNRNNILNQVLVLKWVLGDRKYHWLLKNETYESAIPEMKKIFK